AQDYSKAFDWCLKAANQECASSQYELGEIYYFGKGAPQVDSKAAEWYVRAAFLDELDRMVAEGRYSWDSESDEEDNTQFKQATVQAEDEGIPKDRSKGSDQAIEVEQGFDDTQMELDDSYEG
ncbi:hypothetical protein BX616_008985, partial [Lobosporangium transversale]